MRNSMSALFLEALTDAEQEEFPKLAKFAHLGTLAGGTALTLQLKHRRSYDFDVFLKKPLLPSLRRSVQKWFGKITIAKSTPGEELTFFTPRTVKITFFYYSFPHRYPLVRTSAISLFHWRDIALDKAFTIGQRAQYRDYVNLFFLMQERKLSLDWIVKNAKKKFEELFPEKLFLQQLVYFEDLKPFSIEFLRKEFNRDEIRRFFEQKVQKYTLQKIK